MSFAKRLATTCLGTCSFSCVAGICIIFLKCAAVHFSPYNLVPTKYLRFCLDVQNADKCFLVELHVKNVRAFNPVVCRRHEKSFAHHCFRQRPRHLYNQDCPWDIFVCPIT